MERNSKCIECGKNFTAYHHSTFKPKFCSHRCANTHSAPKRRRSVTRICKKCNNTFELTPGADRYRKGAKYCSLKCYITKGPDLSKYKTVKCDWCGNETTKLNSRLIRAKRVFCSMACQRLSFKINPPQKKNGYWLENGYKVLYTGNGNGIKEHIQVMENSIGRKLAPNETVHHLNRIKLDNRIENLQLLTREEHQRKHRWYKHMRIKLDKADVEFSRYIRIRDGECVRCHSKGSGKDGITGLQTSHYFGRGNESTRYSPENCDALCFGCHQYWGSENREGYRDFKIKQLGENGFKILQMTYNTKQKKDRRMSYLKAHAMLEDLLETK